MTSQIIQALISTKILKYRIPITHHSPHTGNTPYNTLRHNTYRTTYTVPHPLPLPIMVRKQSKTSISNAPLSLPHTPPIALSAFQLTNTIPTATTSSHSALHAPQFSQKKHHSNTPVEISINPEFHTPPHRINLVTKGQSCPRLVFLVAHSPQKFRHSMSKSKLT